jgi:uncharacterized protein (DUF58 family)
MAVSTLSRYLNPEVLNRLTGRRLDPRGLVLGNLAGAHKSPLAGFAVEFAGHREYTLGDDPKHIDWRVFFNRDQLVVKQYEMETNYVCHLLLDCSASMRYGKDAQQKLSCAAQMIAVLGHMVVGHGDKVSLAVFDEAVRGVVSPSNAMAQIIRMTEMLDRIEPVKKTQMADCLNEITGRMKRREIVMIFSDFFTDLPSLELALQQMRYRLHEVVLFQVMHHDELDFGFDRMTKFVGLEVQRELLAQPEAIRRNYLQVMRNFNQQLEELCERNRIERVLVDTSRDMAEVLIDYLNHRSHLHRGR